MEVLVKQWNLFCVHRFFVALSAVISCHFCATFRVLRVNSVFMSALKGYKCVPVCYYFFFFDCLYILCICFVGKFARNIVCFLEKVFQFECRFCLFLVGLQVGACLQVICRYGATFVQLWLYNDGAKLSDIAFCGAWKGDVHFLLISSYSSPIGYHSDKLCFLSCAHCWHVE